MQPLEDTKLTTPICSSLPLAEEMSGPPESPYVSQVLLVSKVTNDDFCPLTLQTPMFPAVEVQMLEAVMDRTPKKLVHSVFVMTGTSM